MKIKIIVITLILHCPVSIKTMDKRSSQELTRSSQELLKRKLAITIPAHSDDSAEESPGTAGRLQKSAGSLHSPGSPLSGSPVRSSSPLRKLFTPRSPSPKQKKADKPVSYNNSSGNLTEKKEQRETPPKPKLAQEEVDAYFPDDFWK